MRWWIDAGAGASGDMLLGALLDLDPAGLGPAQDAVDEVLARLGEQRILLASSDVVRAGMRATLAEVEQRTGAGRTWREIAPALAGHDAAAAVFELLAQAEAHVHAVPVDDVHFHEVGALDAIADIVAVTTLWQRFAPSEVVVSPVCVGSGRAGTEHGTLSIPGPAVVELLTGVPTFGGAVAHEACTPTGAALLRTMATSWGAQPPMAVTAVGVGAGVRDPGKLANVVRILAGDSDAAPETLIMVETTIDDLDPRIYPDVIRTAKRAGALEAWLVPVIMKHGRPAVVLSAMAPGSDADAVIDVILRETTTLGVRSWPVSRRALERDFVRVLVEGLPVNVKRGWRNGQVLTLQPEYADAQDVAEKTGRPIKEVLDLARWAAAHPEAES